MSVEQGVHEIDPGLGKPTFTTTSRPPVGRRAKGDSFVKWITDKISTSNLFSAAARIGMLLSSAICSLILWISVEIKASLTKIEDVDRRVVVMEQTRQQATENFERRVADIERRFAIDSERQGHIRADVAGLLATQKAQTETLSRIEGHLLRLSPTR